MRFKSLIILVIIFLCLMAVVFIKKSVKPEVPTEERFQDIITAPLNLENINECDIIFKWSSAEEEPKAVNIVKQNGRWIITSDYNVPANEEKLAELINKLDKLQGEFRSDKAGLFADYGIGDEQSLHIIVRGNGSNEELVHLIVGTEKPDWRYNFVRLGGTETVYAVNENLLAEFGFWDKVEPAKFDRNKWIDRYITDFDTENVSSVKIFKTEGGVQKAVLNLIRKTVDDRKKWETVENYTFTVSADKIKSYLNNIKNSTARGVVDPGEEGHFKAPDWQMVIGLTDGRQITVTRGERQTTGSDYYVKVSGAGCDFLVSTGVFNTLDRTDGDFFVDNPFRIEETDVKELNIKDVKENKRFVVVKSSGKVGANSGEAKADEGKKEEIVQWKTKKGKILEESKIREVIQKIKDIKIKTFPHTVPPAKDILLFTVIKHDGKTLNFAISENLTIDAAEYNCLEIDGDNQKYYIENSKVSALKNAVSFLK